MNSADLLRLLLETTLAGSTAVLLVLALRVPVRRWLGASAAYLLWLAVPAAWVAVSLPSPRSAAMPMAMVGGITRVGVAVADTTAPMLPWSALLAAAWSCGVLAMALWLLHQQRRFVHGLGPLRRRADGCWQSRQVAGLPAVIGVLRPKIVLPAGFEQRYEMHERQLVLLHEQVHLRRGDIVLNALLALAQCVYWFNPLLPLALRRCREDQELSCDERVIANSAGARRSYAAAMLKTGLAASPLPVGCHWQNQHPLKERIAMLKRPVPGKKQWFAMVLLAAGVSSIVGFTAWAAQPVRADEAAASASTHILAEPEMVRPNDPQAVNMSPPKYPPSMNTGEVLLQIDVAADGSVAGIMVERSSGYADLDEAAMAAASKWTFIPGHENGVAVARKIRVPVRFDTDETLVETESSTS